MTTEDKCDRLRAGDTDGGPEAIPEVVPEVQEGPSREQKLVEAATAVVEAGAVNGPQVTQMIVPAEPMVALRLALLEYA